MKNYRRRDLGFTLIELLVVVTVIGMLASIVLAGTNRARVAARASAVKKEFQQIQVATQLYFYGHGDRWDGDLQASPAPGLGTDSGVSNPSATGNRCPTAATSMFGSPDIRRLLDELAKLYPSGTVECLETSDGALTYWTIYFTAPSYLSARWNKWCMDNYLYAQKGWLQGNWNGSANRQIRGVSPYLVVTCGNTTDAPPAVTPYASPDW